MSVIKRAIYAFAQAGQPVTIRQTFYGLEVAGVIAKTKAEYATIKRLSSLMRRRGELPYEWFSDATRWMRKPQTWSSPDQMLEASVQLYRRSIWNDQNAYVEIWCEKEALAGVLYEVTEPWDVPLMVCRGYPSLSFLYSAAQAIAAQTKPVHLYYFGDFDPSGVDIARNVQERIHQMLRDRTVLPSPKKMMEILDEIFGTDLATGISENAGPRLFDFTRVAVTAEQIEELDLPTRPTNDDDNRGDDFEDESVELDSIPPATLRAMVEKCIDRHIDQDALAKTKQIEGLERDTLADFAAKYENGEDDEDDEDADS